jgi:hypothetical protein
MPSNPPGDPSRSTVSPILTMPRAGSLDAALPFASRIGGVAASIAKLHPSSPGNFAPVMSASVSAASSIGDPSPP